jgi:hypothetical protein
MNHNYPEGRFPDMSNLPKPRWRDALMKLASPATRMHRYRNLRAAAIHELMADDDCEGKS